MTELPTIVGIGASAGGLEALRAFVSAIPRDSGIAYVIVQHLAPEQPSLMVKLLSAHTEVPVRRIEQGDPVLPDHIHVIPPGPFLEMEEGRFKLVDHPREEGVRTPIDRFLTSLAEASDRLAISVVLSGTGSDGTLGVRAVKARGGIAMVQESISARFPGMPESAAGTGLVDFVLRPQDMPGRILEIVRHRRDVEQDGRRDDLLRDVETQLPEILGRLEQTGHSFAGYKPGTLVRRVLRRMTLLRQGSVEAYLRTLDDRPEERMLLGRDFLIGVTQFFRDPDAYRALAEKALRPLLASDRPEFRVWVAGCSTGEEAYSIALLAREIAEESGDARPWKIFGTDIDLDALRHARTGRYAAAAMEALSDERRRTYFTEEHGGWQVDGGLREMCVFAPHNLLNDPPFSRLDLVSCRNLMIYLDAGSQREVLPRFHYALNPGGCLWLGPSETLGRSDRYFTTIDRAARLFRRENSVSRGYSALSVQAPRRGPPNALRSDGAQPSETGSGPDLERRSEQLFLQRRAAPFATVNGRNQVVYVSETMTSLVRPARGATSTQLDDYLTAELRLPVHTALDEARASGQDAVIRNVVTYPGEKPVLMDIAVTPFGDGSDLMLVSLSDVRLRDLAAEDQDPKSLNRDTDHAQELLLTRKRLSALEAEYETVQQELGSANEELLSMNEEFQSANEELETSREELQSINEELETINAELTENNRQLARANSDLKNLLESTAIATLFIDANDCVRLFTPELGRLFGVQERDIGRSIHDLSRRVDYPDLAEDARTVRETLEPIERELSLTATQETFQARIRPYRTIHDRLDGVVITFVDITGRKRNERQLEANARVLSEQYAELETLYDTAPVGLNLLDRDLRYLRINDRLAAINGYPVEAHIGRLQSELLPEAHALVADIQRRILETGEPVLGTLVETETPAEPGRLRHFAVDYYPVKHGETVVAVGSCVREITHERELENRLAESEARLRHVLEEAPVAITIHEGPDLVVTYSNRRSQEEVDGRSIVGLPLLEALPELAGGALEARMRAVLETAEPVEPQELTALLPADTPDGARRLYRNVVTPLQDPSGAVTGVISFSVDLSAEQQARRDEQRQRERLQRLQDSLNSFVGLLSPDGTLLEANATALERGGLTRDDVIGRKFWDCWWWSYSPESQARLRAAVARAAGGEIVRYDVPLRVAGGEMITIEFQLVPNFDSDWRVTEIVPSGVDVTARVAAEQRKDILLAELEHRVKNVLATVRSVARFTARMAVSKEHMAQSLVDRLAALSRTHDALTGDGWQGRSLRALAEAEVAPYSDTARQRFVYDGDDLMLDPAVAMSVGLALHELATNAAKYGAFSTPAGRVRMTVKRDGARLARLEWHESGGPKVKPPEREGFGSFLIQTLLERELDATVRVGYEEDGLHCVIESAWPVPGEQHA